MNDREKVWFEAFKAAAPNCCDGQLYVAQQEADNTLVRFDQQFPDNKQRNEMESQND